MGCYRTDGLLFVTMSLGANLFHVQKEQDKGVLQTLPGHEGLVTCIHFNDDNTGFFSADEKGTVRCWKRHAGDDRVSLFLLCLI